MEWLSSLYVQGIVLSLYFVPLFILVVIVLCLKRFTGRNRSNPLGADLLRPAGYSLQRSIDDLQTDLMQSFVALPIMATLAPLALLLQEKLFHKVANAQTWLVLISISAVAVGYYVYKAIRVARRLPQLRLGLACEMAVGQELDQVIRPETHPYRVFHDIQFEGFNVDHLVIGPNGVFVIETKGRSKHMLDGKKQAKVRLEGNALHFPTHVETQPLEQVRMTVKAVRKWLLESTGFEVPVAGVLVLPGWYVELKQRATDPYVLSGKALSSQLPKLKAGSMELGEVQAVAYQVAQRVRDVDRERVV
ncbi:nuclease-related domain-containing protein [Marinobacterium mangrovicola]|uniref:Nuclease-like protein n=1 Tax=Marinobacterium mangrovicola TaxID=1476959 RepID=A0A4R1GDG9_9GAMM|nr:nuclease-related domain-containing protein [Marinobacterium mangrovicola]TCK06134.1 nuclease-like protein [Marinobacterium mangrovicola]